MRHNNLYNCSSMSYCVAIFILYTFVEFKDRNATVNRFSVVVKSATTEASHISLFPFFYLFRNFIKINVYIFNDLNNVPKNIDS